MDCFNFLNCFGGSSKSSKELPILQEGKIEVNDKKFTLSFVCNKSKELFFSKFEKIIGGIEATFGRIQDYIHPTHKKEIDPITVSYEEKNNDFTEEEIAANLNAIKQNKDEISRVNKKIQEMEAKNLILQSRLEVEKEEFDFEAAFGKVGDFFGHMFVSEKVPEIKKLTRHEKKIEATEREIIITNIALGTLKELNVKFEKRRTTLADSLQDKTFKSIHPEKMEDIDITTFNAIKNPALELKINEEKFMAKMIFLRDLVDKVGPENKEVLIRHLDNIIHSVDAFLKRVGTAGTAKEILSALDPKELDSLFKNIDGYAKENFLSDISIKQFDIQKVLEFTKEAILPPGTNRPGNEMSATLLLQSLLIEPFQKAARYQLTYNEIQSNIKKCAMGNEERKIAPCPILNSFVKAMEEIQAPLQLMTNVFNIYCP